MKITLSSLQPEVFFISSSDLGLPTQALEIPGDLGFQGRVEFGKVMKFSRGVIPWIPLSDAAMSSRGTKLCSLEITC